MFQPNHFAISRATCLLLSVVAFTCSGPAMAQSRASAAAQAMPPPAAQSRVGTADELPAITAYPAAHGNDGSSNPGTAVDPANTAKANMQPEREATIEDPWEGYNRGAHKFNLKVDAYFARPLAKAYDTVTPAPVQRSVTNFFSNLQSPRTLANQLLQARPVEALRTLGRFATNSTIGLAGLFDPAASLGLRRSNEDFGQTLAVWGWETSRFVVVPFLGPRTIRDISGGFLDSPLAPLGYVDNQAVVWSLKLVQLANSRTQALPLDAIRADALDDYALIRDVWMQRREGQIRDGDTRSDDN